jgi:hypothetical protein
VSVLCVVCCQSRQCLVRILTFCSFFLAPFLVWTGPAQCSDNFVLFAPGAISAEPLWGFTFLQGASAGRDSYLVDLLRNPWSGNYGDGWFIGAAASRKIARFYQHFTLEGEVGVGTRFGHNEGAEGWAAVFLRIDGFPWDHILKTTVGASTGLDILTNPEFEEHVLHYFAPEITLALPKFPQTELVFRYHHRSGVFGTFGSVREGSNVISLGIRIRR